MRSSILEKILSALKILSLEWTHQEHLTLIGSPPPWASQEFDCIDPSTQCFEAAEFSPFLENFLFDAQEFWQTDSNEFLRSGFWSETLASGEEISLEAVALHLEGRKIILVESSEASYSESFKWLQTARQERLNFISERKIATTQLLSATFYDALTGLPNQVFFSSQLNQTFEHNSHTTNPRQDYSPPQRKADAEVKTFAVVMLNIDRFTTLNDSLGREMGDRLLIAFAERLQSSLRKQDTPVRFGSDEFGILLRDITSASELTATVQRITETLNQPFSLNHQEHHISTSVGVAPHGKNYHHPRDLLRDASIALHQAKALGRGRYLVFDRAMQARALELWSLESDLRRALKQNELQVFYQPLVNLKTHRVDSFEALVRWQHPSKGWIAPGEFVPMAEETGLILELDAWVLQQACQVITAWQKMTTTPMTVNVNLSSRHFSETNLLDNVKRILQASETQAHNLKLEITESFLLGDTQVATQTLNQLRSLGVKLSIDDFGTGYASLGYLQDLPVDNLKIDGYFIDTMAENNAEIVNTIITLSHNLGIDVTAERVETLAQYQELQRLGCDYAQGFLIARPLAATEAAKFINQTFEHFLAAPKAQPSQDSAPPKLPTAA